MSDKIELTEEELNSKIKAAVAEATEGLVNKNKELLGELKTARKGQEIKPEQLEALENERDEVKAELAKLQKDLKKAHGDLKTATEALEGESNFTKSLLIDNGLSAELVKNGVTNPAHQKAAIAMLRSGVTVEADGDKRVAKMGDKALADAVKEWAGGEEGKHFVTAASNSGGGASGGKGGGAAQVQGKIDGSEQERTAHFAQKYNLESA